MIQELERWLNKDDPLITNLSNAAAVMYEAMDGVNWLGFYLMQEGELILGPFQGKAARTHIAVGEGVCGTAVAQKAVQLVEDVHKFPGHIACDCASNAEIVVPITVQGEIVAVIDVDSPFRGHFTTDDQETLEKAAQMIAAIWRE